MFRELDFSLMEMNPFTLDKEGLPFPLDMRGELDDTAAFKSGKKCVSAWCSTRSTVLHTKHGGFQKIRSGASEAEAVWKKHCCLSVDLQLEAQAPALDWFLLLL